MQAFVTAVFSQFNLRQTSRFKDDGKLGFGRPILTVLSKKTDR